MRDRIGETAHAGGAGTQRKSRRGEPKAADDGRAPRAAARRSRGQAIVELALLLPLFLLLTLGVVDMARVFTSYVSLTNGVSNAAIYAAQGGYNKWCSGESYDVPCPPGATVWAGNPDSIAYQVQVEASGMTLSGINLAVPQCTPVSGPVEPCTSTTPGAYLNVKIAASYDVSLLTPLLGAILGGSVHMSASTTAVMY